MDMGLYMSANDETMAPPVYDAVRKTGSEANALAEGGSSPSRVDNFYPDTTLIENDLYE